MKMLIDSTELKLLLERKRDSIGKSVQGVDVLFAGVTFGLSILYADFQNLGFISGDSVRTVCIILSIAFSIRGIIMILKSVKDKYGHTELYDDIEKLNGIQHRFSIVAVKDTFNQYPNRFLLYYDERWDCKFFFSYKTVDNDTDNIITKLSNELKVDRSNIKIDFKTEQIQQKYSVSHNEDRVYDHRVYSAEISKFRRGLTADEFEIDGKKYYWMTIQDMERDERIKEVNLDVVSLIKESV